MIGALAKSCGIEAHRIPGLTGVWVGNKKVPHEHLDNKTLNICLESPLNRGIVSLIEVICGYHSHKV